MKKSISKKVDPFNDFFDLLNKSLASNTQIIKNLELNLYSLDKDFSLIILPKDQWTFSKDSPVFTSFKNHTIYVREDSYINAYSSQTPAGFILLNEYFRYYTLNQKNKNLIYQGGANGK